MKKTFSFLLKGVKKNELDKLYNINYLKQQNEKLLKKTPGPQSCLIIQPWKVEEHVIYNIPRLTTSLFTSFLLTSVNVKISKIHQELQRSVQIVTKTIYKPNAYLNPLVVKSIDPWNENNVTSLYTNVPENINIPTDQISITMVDMVGLNPLTDLNPNHSYSCFWHKHSFSTVPLGCPIYYHPRIKEENYTSSINGEKYVLNKYLRYKLNTLETKTANFTEEYYITDGIFCSFSCILAFIYDEMPKNPSMYQYSESLLYHMYTNIYKQHPFKSFNPAPHWRTLKTYGGDTTLEKYIKSLSTLSYQYVHSNLLKLPICKTLGHMYVIYPN